MKAMILAAGFGRRLHPLTLEKPKPLLEIGNETLLSNTLRFLEKSEIEEVVINVHYLGKKIINYIKEKKFNLKINIVEEKDKIYDTGGGILNTLKLFSKEPFIVINPDTIWNVKYLEEIKLLKEIFFSKKNSKCILLVVNKEKSFDKSFQGDFNLINNLINRNKTNGLQYVYTGLQIIKPEAFLNVNDKIFSINKIWDTLIENNQLYGLESKINFLHVSTLKIYNNIVKNLNVN
jgi:MurNAc alpha-1-phosphate uridylyltransferase